MEALMADDFTSRAVRLTIQDLAGEIRAASREYEDAVVAGDEVSAAYALKIGNAKQLELDNLTGANHQPPQPAGQPTAGQQQFLARHGLSADDPVVIAGHHRALAYGHRIDTPQYEAAILGHLASAGDGRQGQLDERSAAEISGISDAEYSAQANKLAWLRSRGLHD
jgi:hypothetical protein